jgi:hypothetical protein
MSRIPQLPAPDSLPSSLTSSPTNPNLRIPPDWSPQFASGRKRIQWPIASLPLAACVAAVRAAPRGRVRWTRFRNRESESRRPTCRTARWVFSCREQFSVIGCQRSQTTALRAPVAKWLTRRSAKPVYAGSIPARCSRIVRNKKGRDSRRDAAFLFDHDRLCAREDDGAKQTAD